VYYIDKTYLKVTIIRRLLIEVCLFQEKTVALKIFELGLKKFGDVTDYIRAYVDFMSHLNGKKKFYNSHY
jgi:hypothetical protein